MRSVGKRYTRRVLETAVAEEEEDEEEDEEEEEEEDEEWEEEAEDGAEDPLVLVENVHSDHVAHAAAAGGGENRDDRSEVRTASGSRQSNDPSMDSVVFESAHLKSLSVGPQQRARCICESVPSKFKPGFCKFAEQLRNKIHLSKTGMNHRCFGTMYLITDAHPLVTGVSLRKRWLHHLGIDNNLVEHVPSHEIAIRWSHFSDSAFQTGTNKLKVHARQKPDTQAQDVIRSGPCVAEAIIVPNFDLKQLELELMDRTPAEPSSSSSSSDRANTLSNSISKEDLDTIRHEFRSALQDFKENTESFAGVTKESLFSELKAMLRANDGRVKKWVLEEGMAGAVSKKRTEFSEIAVANASFIEKVESRLETLEKESKALESALKEEEQARKQNEDTMKIRTSQQISELYRVVERLSGANEKAQRTMQTLKKRLPEHEKSSSTSATDAATTPEGPSKKKKKQKFVFEMW